jgi:hypothetical protein
MSLGGQPLLYAALVNAQAKKDFRADSCCSASTPSKMCSVPTYSWWSRCVPRMARENQSWGLRIHGELAGLVLAVIEHGSRCVRVLGATENPVKSWVVQQARTLLMGLEDAGIRVKFVRLGL